MMIYSIDIFRIFKIQTSTDSLLCPSVDFALKIQRRWQAGPYDLGSASQDVGCQPRQTVGKRWITKIVQLNIHLLKRYLERI